MSNDSDIINKIRKQGIISVEDEEYDVSIDSMFDILNNLGFGCNTFLKNRRVGDKDNEWGTF